MAQTTGCGCAAQPQTASQQRVAMMMDPALRSVVRPSATPPGLYHPDEYSAAYHHHLPPSQQCCESDNYALNLRYANPQLPPPILNQPEPDIQRPAPHSNYHHHPVFESGCARSVEIHCHKPQPIHVVATSHPVPIVPIATCQRVLPALPACHQPCARECAVGTTLSAPPQRNIQAAILPMTPTYQPKPTCCYTRCCNR